MLFLAMTEHESEGIGSTCFQSCQECDVTTGEDLLAMPKGTDT